MSYHIAKNGAPAVCTAQPGKCPLETKMNILIL